MLLVAQARVPSELLFAAVIFFHLVLVDALRAVRVPPDLLAPPMNGVTAELMVAAVVPLYLKDGDSLLKM